MPQAQLTGASSSSSTQFAAAATTHTAGSAVARVANMINAWDVDQVFALGDNNYQTGSADTIDANVGECSWTRRCWTKSQRAIHCIALVAALAAAQGSSSRATSRHTGATLGLAPRQTVSGPPSGAWWCCRRTDRARVPLLC